MISVIAIFKDSNRQVEARCSHLPPNLFCAISDQTTSTLTAAAANNKNEPEQHVRNDAQRGLILEYPCAVSFKHLDTDEDDGFDVDKLSVLHVKIDLTRFLSMLRRSVTVVAEPYGATTQKSSSGGRPGIAIPGYADAAEANSPSSSRSPNKQRTITWCGRLDLATSQHQQRSAGMLFSSRNNMLMIRLIVGGHLVHSAGGTVKDDGGKQSFTAICPLFYPQTAFLDLPSFPATPAAIARINAVAMAEHRSVKVATACLIERQHGDSATEGGGGIKRFPAALDVVVTERVLGSSVAATTGTQASRSRVQQSIEIRVQNVGAVLNAQQQSRNLELLLDLKVQSGSDGGAGSSDEPSIVKAFKSVVPASVRSTLSSPWFVVGAFAVVLLSLIASALLISLKQK